MKLDPKKLDEAVAKADALGRSDAEPYKRLYPSYATSELKEWLAGNKIDAATRAKVETEVAARESGVSKHKVTPQIMGGNFKPMNKIGRM